MPIRGPLIGPGLRLRIGRIAAVRGARCRHGPVKKRLARFERQHRRYGGATEGRRHPARASHRAGPPGGTRCGPGRGRRNPRPCTRRRRTPEAQPVPIVRGAVAEQAFAPPVRGTGRGGAPARACSAAEPAAQRAHVARCTGGGHGGAGRRGGDRPRGERRGDCARRASDAGCNATRLARGLQSPRARSPGGGRRRGPAASCDAVREAARRACLTRRDPVTAGRHSPMRGHDRPRFHCGEQAPYNFPGLAAH